MFKRNQRILWLINHRTLMPFEARLIADLGFEIFVPKVIPNSPSFRSGAIDLSYDTTLTIPPAVLARLNKFNFYEDVWRDDIVTLTNRYFGTAFVIPYAIQVKEALKKFEGQIMFRAFGLDNSQTYERVLTALYGTDLLAEIAAAGKRFWFAAGYEYLSECEPPLFKDREIVLPVGVSDSAWRIAGSYTGIDKRILFVCPSCVTNPYYSEVYRKFKRELGDLPHVIVGTQDVPVNDAHVLGFVPDDELFRLYRECAVMYYPSQERRHVHYTPIEAAITGMPVMYYAESLLGRLTPEVRLGRCTSHLEARQSVERILSGDSSYIKTIRNDQRTLANKFTPGYCKAVWERNFRARGFQDAVRPELASVVTRRELKRLLLQPFARGLSSIPQKNQPLITARASLMRKIFGEADNSTKAAASDSAKSRIRRRMVQNISSQQTSSGNISTATSAAETTPSRGEMNSENQTTPFVSPSTEEVELAVATLRANWDVYHVPLTPRRWFLEPILNGIRRVFRRLLGPILARQVAYNLAQTRVTNFLYQRQDELQAAQDSLLEKQQALQQHRKTNEWEIQWLKKTLAESTVKIGELQAEIAELQANLPVIVPTYTSPPEPSLPMEESRACFHRKELGDWYRPIILGPSTVRKYATGPRSHFRVVEILEQLERSIVVNYLLEYYKHGMAKYGDAWVHADIRTVLVSLAELMQPQRYLEVGVFHGQSMAMMGALCPDCEIVGFDLWIPKYAGLDNFGPDFVRKQLERVGHRASVTLISGDSHVTLPEFFAAHPTESFDVITVDGDHTEEGAAQDLMHVIPHLRTGGFLVFDDIAYSGFAHLTRVWSQLVASDPRFITWVFRELGNGVAVGLKQY
jgi:predicted O-methyltransferase YrrM